MARGRKSLAAQSVVIQGAFGQRPEPPENLSEAAATIWRRTVASETVEFFRTAALQSILADYCRHTETADLLTVKIDAFRPEWLEDDDGLKRLDMLLKLRERETRSSSDRATKLRLTNQARYTPRAAEAAARHQSVAKKPWEAG